MSTTGETLRAERERRGLSLDDLADTTKIQKRHLQAIERGDYDDLPGEVFAKGYVKSFAEALGLDSARIADGYTRERTESGAYPVDDTARQEGAARAALERLAELGPGAETRSRPALPWIAAAVVVLVLALGGWALLRGNGDAASAADGRSASAERTPALPPPSRTPVEAQPAPTRVATDDATDAETTPVPVEPAADAPAGDAKDDRAAAAADAGEQATATRVEREAPPATATPAPDLDERQTTAPTERPVETPAPAPPPAATGSRLSVEDFGVGTDVRNLTLIGRGDVFREGQGIVFWTRVVGGSRGDTLRHVWLLEGRAVASIRLRIGGSHWRTYSSKSLTPGSAGDWAVEARDVDGNVLARSTFSVVP